MKDLIYGLVLSIVTVVIVAFGSCGNKLKQEVNEYNGNGYVQFEYLDRQHITATAINAIWLSAGYKNTDTIVLNPNETVLITLPEDEFTVSIGNGDTVNLSFTF